MKNKLLLALIVVGLIFSEIAFELTPTIGYIIYASFVFGMLLMYSKAYFVDDELKVFVLLMIIPLLRVAEVFLDFSFYLRTLCVYIAFAFLIFFYSINFDIKIESSKNKMKILPYVILGGILAGEISSKIIGIGEIFNLIYLIPLIAVSEELYFRGMIQKLIKQSYNKKAAIAVSSILYLVFCLSFGLSAIFLFGMAIVSAILYEKYQNIYLSIGFNLSFQIMLFAI